MRDPSDLLREEAEQPVQTMSSVNPYGVPKLAWSLIEEYLVEKYKLVYAEVNPTTKVDTPTITWRILRRVPGAGKEMKSQARGPSYQDTLKRDAQGLLHERSTQRHRVTYEWSVYGTSTEQVNNLAWDLEQALIALRGPLAEKIEGFNWTFEQQVGDTSMSWRAQDELMVRTIRFEAEVPISYVNPLPQISKIETKVSVGPRVCNNMRFRRLTDDCTFEVPLEKGSVLLEIIRVWRLVGNGNKGRCMQVDIDYRVQKDERGVPHIKWLDEFGATPQVGQDFLIDYTLATTLPSSDNPSNYSRRND